MYIHEIKRCPFITVHFSFTWVFKFSGLIDSSLQYAYTYIELKISETDFQGYTLNIIENKKLY